MSKGIKEIQMSDTNNVSARVTEAFLNELGESLDHANLVVPIREILAQDKTLKSEKLLSIYEMRLVEAMPNEEPQ